MVLMRRHRDAESEHRIQRHSNERSPGLSEKTADVMVRLSRLIRSNPLLEEARYDKQAQQGTRAHSLGNTGVNTIHPGADGETNSPTPATFSAVVGQRAVLCSLRDSGVGVVVVIKSSLTRENVRSCRHGHCLLLFTTIRYKSRLVLHTFSIQCA